MEIETMPLNGDISPPRANGEVIFEAPWQSRVFGLARVLCEQGHYDWDEFRQCLIGQISGWESTQEANIQKESADNESTGNQPLGTTTGETNSFEYFNHFLAALDELLQLKNLCSAEELKQRISALEARPHGHDH